MKPVLLLLSGCWLAIGASRVHAAPMDPLELSRSTATVEQPMLAEQSHLQSASLEMRTDAMREGDLPQEFKRPTGPKAHHLLNMSF